MTGEGGKKLKERNCNFLLAFLHSVFHNPLIPIKTHLVMALAFPSWTPVINSAPSICWWESRGNEGEGERQILGENSPHL